MFVVAAAFIGYYALLVYSDLARPEPSGAILQVQGSSIVVRAVVPGSPAARAGVQPGDRLLTANGRALRNHLDWLLAESNLGAGRPLNLEIARNDASESDRRTIVLGRASHGFW